MATTTPEEQYAIDNYASDEAKRLALEEVADSDWICSCFMIPRDSSWEYEQEKRYYTHATRKVGGAGLGDGRVLNMPPSVNEFADIPVSFGIAGEHDGTGLGVHGIEGTDDNLDVIHLRPGLPRYSSLGRFYANAVSSDAVKLNEYGWFDSAVSNLTGALGYLLTIPFKIVLSPFNIIGQLSSNDSTNRYSYYYLAPATHAYWKTLDNIVNDFAIRSGLIPGANFEGEFDDGSTSNKVIRDEDLDYFVKNMPGVYRSGNFGVPRIDVLAISCRHKVLTSRREEYLSRKIKEMGDEYSEVNEAYLAEWETLMRTHNPWGDDESVKGLDGVQALGDSMTKSSMAMKGNYDKIAKAGIASIVDSTDVSHDVTVVDGVATASETIVETDTTDYGLTPELDDSNFTSNFSAITATGADWISLAVDHVTESKISVTNNTGPSGLASMINGMVSTMRGVDFNLAGGNIGDNALANTVEGLITTGKAAIGGLVGSFVGGMPSAILGGKAFIDIPDVYQDSTMEFGNFDYKITSYSSSGHPLAKLQMLMPYFALLALASPRSAGPSAYSPPFLVELQHKGIGIVELGMIDKLAATFGDIDGWDVNNIPNKVEIDFSVVNLSKGFHVPVDPELTLTYQDTGAFNMHMSVLAGVSLTDRDRSLWYNAKRAGMRLGQNLDRLTSKTYYAHLTGTMTRDLVGGLLTLGGHYTNRR